MEQWCLFDFEQAHLKMITTGPVQLGSCDHTFPKNITYYGLQLKECQKWKEHIKNTKMAFSVKQ